MSPPGWGNRGRRPHAASSLCGKKHRAVEKVGLIPSQRGRRFPFALLPSRAIQTYASPAPTPGRRFSCVKAGFREQAMANVAVIGAQWGDEGNGVVVDPWHFLEEVKKVSGQGVSVTPENLKIANHAVLILPLHRDLDGWREDVPGTIKIGTTRRGIGPAYEDKVG